MSQAGESVDAGVTPGLSIQRNHIWQAAVDCLVHRGQTPDSFRVVQADLSIPCNPTYIHVVKSCKKKWWWKITFQNSSCVHQPLKDENLVCKKCKQMLCSHQRREGKELIFDLSQVTDRHNLLISKVYITHLNLLASWMTWQSTQSKVNWSSLHIVEHQYSIRIVRIIVLVHYFITITVALH